jgi:hypothetical protein
MLAPQTSVFNIATITIPPAPAGTVNTITYRSPYSPIFAANSNAYNRIESVASYSTAATNFTMDYVAGPSDNNTTFGWRLTSVANPANYIFGYAYVDPSNQWTVNLGDKDSTAFYSPVIYSELSPAPKFRVVLNTANNISISLVNSDNTIAPIGNFNSINIGSFKASFGRHDDGNPTATLEQTWTLSSITVG